MTEPEADQLRADIEWWGEHKGFVWQILTDDEWAHLERSMQAARCWLQVLDSPVVEACESHESMWLNDDDGCEAALSGQVKPWRNPCRIRRYRLVPVDEGKET